MCTPWRRTFYWLFPALIGCGGLDLASEPGAQLELDASSAALYRVNAGGPELTGTPAWSADTGTSPSPYVNASQIGGAAYTTTETISVTHPSIPSGTPSSMFQ